MKTLVAIGAIGILASGLFAQGLNHDGQTRESWEEINFEFNSSILSDGYPSLLRLADVLSQHKDYRVKVTGNTDYVGSAAYNDKLAMQRAEAVKAFLVKYGASADQITTASEGKRIPEVDNASKEGRFMNRRVTLEVRDGQGKLVGDGRIGDILPALADLENAMKQQQDCCAQILKRLDKLDDILAALGNLKGENDSLKSQIADLRNQQNALKDQVNGLTKPLTEQQTTTIANNAANGALDEAAKRNQKFSLLGINVGPNIGTAKGGDASVNARGQFFSPFGGTGTSAVQAQGEYIYNSGFSSEGQFDIGLVHRAGAIQAGAFGSFKYVNLSQYAQGGALGQASILLDYVFKGGRIGAFGTQGFKNYAILNNVELVPGVYSQAYARIVNQYGIDGMVNVWGDAYLEGNLGILRRHVGTGINASGNSNPGGGTTAGGEIRLVQPLTPHLAFTVEGDINEALVANTSTGRIAFGLQFGNFVKPKEFADSKSPVPMDVPRIRYELGTRRVGTAAPIANAGPDQLNIPAAVVTLDGSGSYDPLGETLSYQWQQVNGPAVTLSNATSPKASFTASAGNSYGFRLTVTNTDGLKGTANTVVSTQTAVATPATIVEFIATPASITAGQSSTLQWITQNVTSVSIAPGIGTVTSAGSGSIAVSPTATTTYTLTATGPSGTTTQTAIVTVTAASSSAQILRFDGSPLTIQPGQQSTLSWATSGATTVTISGLGSVAVNGSTTVSPTATTTYTLTATSAAGQAVTAAITISVVPAAVPQIVAFTAVPAVITSGQSSQVCWQVNNATSIAITGIGSSLNATACQTVTPTATTTYTMTATNASGSTSGSVTVTVGQLQVLSFTANPTWSTAQGSAVTLSWTTQGATSVVLIGGDLTPQSNLAVNGSFTIHPMSDETYTLTAYGPGGQTVSVTISVFVR